MKISSQSSRDEDGLKAQEENLRKKNTELLEKLAASRGALLSMFPAISANKKKFDEVLNSRDSSSQTLTSQL
ncbi:hypothetical protein DAPPUDRAFT_245718 [Daphnia pulex]|uniref:Uncharacterized protein n=1 Tax=Daphnia pulex TaxID=6669 RepID=E9GNX4_DAPPU|nr:hypothetical protein DAPPUDRAFT_245718 [Daphnia pulex]|eukprot:EFX78871.1 hypothetical protein DAPPUDRAFT_245718 [Daphnia pulex]